MAAAYLAPLVDERLETVRRFRLLSLPLGEMLFPLLSGRSAQMTWDALSRILKLDDEDLGILIDLVGCELGAWRGYSGAPTAAEIAAAEKALGRLTGALEE